MHHRSWETSGDFYNCKYVIYSLGQMVISLILPK